MYIQQQAFVKQILLSACYLIDKCLLLYVKSSAPDDGRKERPKHVECHSKMDKYDTPVHVVGFNIEIILRCTAL